MLVLIVLYLLLESFCCPNSEVDNQAYRIGKIVVCRNKVFDKVDSTRSNWILDLANQIHVLTKESAIRSRLLFKEGDVYDQSLIDESGRILRSIGVIGDVNIICDTVSVDIVDITIITNDKWTLGINTSYKHDGGITSYSTTIKDDNFLGNAQGISLGYNYSSERRNRHGAELIFKEPHLFSTWWKLTMQYKSNEHLDIKTILVERPFYSYVANWSVGTYLDAGRSRIRNFSEGIATKEYDIYQENKLLWGTLSSNIWPRVAIGLGYVNTRTTSDAGMFRLADNVDFINLSFSVMNRWYYTARFIENFGRVEDIPLGYHGSITMGKNFHNSETLSPQWFLKVNWGHVFRPSTDWYLAYDVTLSEFLVESKAGDATVSLGCLQHLRLTQRQILALRTSIVLGENWSPGAKLMLGSQTGLRGYPAYGLSGTRQFLVNLEHRFFSDIEFWIFRFGSVIFFDIGTMWNEGEQLGLQRFHSSAGFGLRIENTKQVGSGIIRIDFAFNFDKNRIAQVIFSSDHLFRAFQNIDYASPTELR